MHWVVRPWRHAFKFTGRATRREYWLFQAQLVVAYIAVVVLVALVVEGARSDLGGGVVGVGSMLALLLFFILSLASGVRRVHDHDKTGWIFFLIMTLTPGTAGENDYGRDPREGDHPSAEEMASIFS
jgi:uncharacterized membrane protein YhaH (DUF805 family)